MAHTVFCGSDLDRIPISNLPKTIGVAILWRATDLILFGSFIIKLGLTIMICSSSFCPIQIKFYSQCVNCLSTSRVFCQTSLPSQKEHNFGPLKTKWIGRSDRIGDPENASGLECGIRSNFSKGSGIRSKKIGSVRSLH
jgi:hypothetical protein